MANKPVNLGPYKLGTTRSKDVDGRPSNTGSIEDEDGRRYEILGNDLVHSPIVKRGPVPDGAPCLFIPIPEQINRDDGNRTRPSAQNILIAYRPNGHETGDVFAKDWYSDD